MVRGLAKFKERLGAYADQYTLIGGAACDLLMDEAGLTFRATKDLDIVLCVERLRADFVDAFWEFVKVGQYEHKESAEGKKTSSSTRTMCSGCIGCWSRRLSWTFRSQYVRIWAPSWRRW